MTPDEFYTANALVDEYWEYLGKSDSGELMFTRVLGGVRYQALISEDK